MRRRQGKGLPNENFGGSLKKKEEHSVISPKDELKDERQFCTGRVRREHEKARVKTGGSGGEEENRKRMRQRQTGMSKGALQAPVNPGHSKAKRGQ